MKVRNEVNVELSLLVRYIVVLFIPMIYLYSVATYVYARSAHLKVARILGGFALIGAVAYTIDTLRLFLPIQMNFWLHIFVVLTLMNFAMSMKAHMFYELVKPLVKYKTDRIVYLFYLLPILILGTAVINIFSEGRPIYSIENSWVYTEPDATTSINFVLALAFYSVSIVLIMIGYSKATTKSLRNFFLSMLTFTVIGAIAVFLWKVGVYQIDYILPPTPGLILIVITSSLFLVLLVNVDIMPSTHKKYAALMTSSPTPIIHINDRYEIMEQNIMANFIFQLEEGQKLTNYFGFNQNARRFEQLFSILDQEQYVKGFEVTYTDANNEACYILIDGARITLGQQITYYLMIHDVTLEQRSLKINEYYAYHDSLTNLHNRVYFEREVKLALSRQSELKQAAFILMDLNFFKIINDTYGHKTGDEVLIAVGKLLDECLPKPHILARLGGDEFVMFIEQIESKQKVERLLQQIRQHFKRHPFRHNEASIEILPSIGIAYMEEEQKTYEELYHEADLAMYKDKEKIKSIYMPYTEKLFS